MSRRTGLLAGGVVILALLVAGVWGAVLSRVLGPDDPDEPAPGPYRVVDRLCEQLDTGPVFDILPPTGDGLDEHVLEVEDGTLRDCIQGLGQAGSTGSLRIQVGVHSDAEIARRRHEGDLSGGTIAESSASTEEAQGPWQAGRLGLGARGFSAGAEICVRDGNLTACVAMRVSAAPELTDPPTDGDLAAAVSRVAEDVLARSRS